MEMLRLRGEDALESVERVIRDVEPDHLALERELLLLVPLRPFRNVAR